MKDPTEALWWMTSKMMEYGQNKGRSDRWRFREGVKLFNNPEARCPNCGVWVSTNRNWLVDEANCKLLRWWDLKGTSCPWPPHPHVGYDGSICMGENTIASASLFTSIASGHHYNNTERFFHEIGHNCPNARKAYCDSCDEEFFESELENGVCENCPWNSNPYCIRCGDNEVDEEGQLCEDCCCPECGEEIAEGSGFCSDHRYECECHCGCLQRTPNNNFICDHCEENCPEDEEEENDVFFTDGAEY